MNKIAVNLMIVLLSIISNEVSAQMDNVTNTSGTLFSNHLHPTSVTTPNAASLGVYSNDIVANYTGTPSINIPLYELKVGNFSLPIQLTYNATGIKINDIPSWVGSGWSLDAGGMITRTVNDIPDDYKTYNSSAYAGIISWLYDDSYGMRDPNTFTFLDLSTMRNNLIDGEPDIFQYNFNKHVGKFIFNSIPYDPSHPPHKILSIPNSDLLFNYTLDSDPVFPTIGSFTISDEEGNQYLFDQAEYESPSYAFGWDWYIPGVKQIYTTAGVGTPIPGNPVGMADQYKTAWYLSKITTAEGKNISFSYASEHYNTDLIRSYSEAGFPNQGVDCSKWANEDGSLNSVGSGLDVHFGALRLSSIQTDDTKIIFNPSDAERPDFAGSYSLKSLQIFATGNLPGESDQLVKEFDFNYNTLVSPISLQSNLGDPTTKRIQLASVTEKGPNGLTKPPYQFSYDNIHTLPSRTSSEQDIWGYYNASGCNSLLPSLYIYPSQTGSNRFSIYPITAYGNSYLTFSAADRTTNSATITAGTLNQITYPTGGYQQFLFEANTYNYQNQNFTGGGIRLKQSTLYDGVSHDHDIIHQYTYTQSSDPTKSSGVLFNMPVFAYTMNFPNYWNPGVAVPPYVTEPSPTTWDYFKYNLVVAAIPMYALSGYDGVNIGYSEIKDHTIGKGTIVSKYGTPGAYGTTSDGSGSCDPNISGYCDGLFTVTTPMIVQNQPCQASYLDPTGLGIDANSFPFAPKLNYDWNRGYLTGQSFFDESNQLAKQISNTYSIYTPNNAGPTITYGLKQGAMTNNGIYAGPSTPMCSVTGFWEDAVISHYPIITNVAKVLSSAVTKTYDLSGNGNYVQETKSYSYATNEMQPSKIETHASNGDIIDEFNYYPLDYSIAGPSSDPAFNGLRNLINSHVTTPVIESYTQRADINNNNQRVIDASLTTYKANSPLPDQIFKIETNNPITNFTPTNFSNTGIGLDPHYKLQGSYDDYDPSGNLWQLTDHGNKTSSVIWGYNRTQPVAEARNAEIDHIAYTSFEEDDEDEYNWSLNDVPISGSLAKTGSNYYCLNRNGQNGVVQTAAYMPPGTYILSFWGSNNDKSYYNLGISGNAGNNLGSVTFLSEAAPENAGDLTYMEFKVVINSPANVGISAAYLAGAPIYIDELRLYPVNAQMKTYTYNKLIGVSSVCDENNMISRYEYDDLNRLVIIRDADGNIVKKFEYGIQAQE